MTPEAIDTKLVSLFDKMDYWCSYCYNDTKNKKIDSLRNASGRIYDFIEAMIVCYPFFMDGEFPEAKARGLKYVNSDDGELRIYSWRAKMEGHGPATRYEFRDVMAYKTRGGSRKYHDISNGTEGAYCTHITTVHTKKDITLYLANYYCIDDGLKTEKIRAYAIINDSVKEISAFMNGNRNPKQLYCDYDINTDRAIADASIIKFSSDKNKLFVPVVEKRDGRHNLTGDFSSYIFNGYMFVFDKVTKP